MSGKTEKMFRRMSRIMSGGTLASVDGLKRAWALLSHRQRGEAHKQIDSAIAMNDREQLEFAIRKGIDVRVQPRRF